VQSLRILFHMISLRSFKSSFCLHALSLSLILPLGLSAGQPEEKEAEAAALALAADQESAGYMFRAEAWTGDLNQGLGKAVRMQLFKGNEYCIGVAVPRKSGVRVTGAVLDLEAKPVGEIQPVLDGWGFLLFFKPKKTGVYMITIHVDEKGKKADTSCAIITGYK
jgi:hypothetical protein